MLWALVENGVIIDVGQPPDLVWDDATSSWLSSTRGPLADFGWLAVVEVTRPADTPTTTWEHTYALIEGVPTEVWTERTLSAEELVARTQAANEAEIGDKIVTVDMPAMQAILDATNATINAGPAPFIKDIAKAVRRLDRKVQRLLDGTG